MSQCYEFNYTANRPQLLPNVWVPCPVGDNCCIGIDTCLSNNICRAHNSGKKKRAGSYSGYYNARCTDPTYTSPACDKICIGSPPDLVYNYTSQRWACCGNNTAGEVTCSDPLPEYYEAPAPALLSKLTNGALFASTATLTPVSNLLAAASTTSSTHLTASSSKTQSSTSSPSQGSAINTGTSQSAQVLASGGLGIGAQAGIGIGVGIAVFVILVAYLLLSRRRKISKRREKVNESHGKVIERHDLISHEIDSTQTRPIQEMPANAKRAPIEIDSSCVAVNGSQQGHSTNRSVPLPSQPSRSTHALPAEKASWG